MVTVVVVGSQGMLGSYICSVLAQANISYVGVARQDFEIQSTTTYDDLNRFVQSKALGLKVWVINTVALAKGTSKREEKEQFKLINTTYSKLWYQICQARQWNYVYISTNGVFASRDQPYLETDEPQAGDEYGQTKYAGECGQVIRSSIIGEDERNYRGLLEFAKFNHDHFITGFTNHMWNGVTALTMAQYLRHLIEHDLRWVGVRHLKPGYVLSKYELLRYIDQIWKLNLDMTPGESKQPQRMLLDTQYQNDFDIPDMKTQLNELKAYGVQNRSAKFDTVLIFGGSGSLGTTLIARWRYRVKTFIIFSRTEHKQWMLQQKFPTLQFEFMLGDVKDHDKVHECISRYNPNTILYAAAMKHVERCETEIDTCLYSNCFGFLNVIRSLTELSNQNRIFHTAQLLYVSTDKACSPINVYGMSKHIGEHAVQNLKIPRVKLLGVRYGNVINSNGSIIPRLHQQSLKNTLTSYSLTDKRMTRFFMTLEQSVELIEDALIYGQNGDIWIPKLKSMKILDLFELFAEKYQKSIEIVGIRPGEKIHESLLAEHEAKNVEEMHVEHRNRYVIKAAPVHEDAPPILFTSANNFIEKDTLRLELDKRNLL